MPYNDTKYSTLEETLKAVGKTVFVEFYYDFKDTSISTDVLAQKLYQNNPRAKSTNQNFRIARARHIFETGQQIEVLNIIIGSSRVDPTVRQIATTILEKERALQFSSAEFSEEQLFIATLNLQLPYSNETDFEYDNSPKPAKTGTDITTHKYPRSRSVAQRALAKANHLCECNASHLTFKRKSCDINYTEPHHLIPLHAAKDFPNIDLDREQNVVSLCSTCHNWLHYGNDVDSILQPLYEKRKNLLKAIGAEITYEQLRSYYI